MLNLNMYREVKEHWFREFTRTLWVKTLPTSTKNNHKWIKWFNKMIHRYAFKCKHTHTFMFDLPKDTPWYFKGEMKGTHSGLAIIGCYLCGEMKVIDYQA